MTKNPTESILSRLSTKRSQGEDYKLRDPLIGIQLTCVHFQTLSFMLLNSKRIYRVKPSVILNKQSLKQFITPLNTSILFQLFIKIAIYFSEWKATYSTDNLKAHSERVPYQASS